MSHPATEQPLPKALLISAAALIAFTVAAAAAVRISGVGATPIAITAVQIESYELTFSHHSDGTVVVNRYPDGQRLDILAPDSNGFIRGVLRGLSRQRIRHNINLQSPFRLNPLV